MRLNNKYFDEIRGYLDTVPVIETHEHHRGTAGTASSFFGFVASDIYYYFADLRSAAHRYRGELERAMHDGSMSFDERYAVFERAYNQTRHTAYARAVQIGLKECWGIEEINRETMRELDGKDKTCDERFYRDLAERFGIKAKIVDVGGSPAGPEFAKLIQHEKTDRLDEYCRLAFPLPSLHNIHSKADIVPLQRYLGHGITCLDDYLESISILLEKCIESGLACIKDQSAYRRRIRYELPSRGEAEAVFNKIISRPRNVFGTEEVEVLDDWLFHHFMRLARQHDLPVQIHTGHMAGLGNDVSKANAANMISVLELHSGVAFDLFHGNWPYMGDILFIVKNHPNAYLDLCWVNAIDPLYCVEIMKRALVTVPHSKVMAFGGDSSRIEWVVGYLVMARDNVACALSEMVDIGWIGVDEAKQIAADWFFNNPNEFFRLGFERFIP